MQIPSPSHPSAFAQVTLPAPVPVQRESLRAQAQLETHLAKVAEHIKNDIESDEAMLDADIQNAYRCIGYINKQQPDLHLRYACSLEALMRQLASGHTSPARFIVQNTVNRNHYYMEIRHLSDGRPTAILFNHAGFDHKGPVGMMLQNFREQAMRIPALEKIHLLQVDTFKQANKFDTVMFAAHSAWIAQEQEHASAYENLHDMAGQDAGHKQDEGRLNPGMGASQLFSESFYEYEQLLHCTPPEPGRKIGNYMPIFDFRRQLLTGALAMLQNRA